MGPKAKGRPGPYSKQRDVGYGEDLEESKVDEAQQEARRTNPYYASSKSSRAPRPPPVDPPTEEQMMLQLSAAYTPGAAILSRWSYPSRPAMLVGKPVWSG